MLSAACSIHRLLHPPLAPSTARSIHRSLHPPLTPSTAYSIPKYTFNAFPINSDAPSPYFLSVIS